MLVAAQYLPDSRLLCIGSTNFGHHDLTRLRSRNAQSRIVPAQVLPLFNWVLLQVAVGCHLHGCVGPQDDGC